MFMHTEPQYLYVNVVVPSSRIERSERKANHSPSSSDEVMFNCALGTTSPFYLCCKLSYLTIWNKSYICSLCYIFTEQTEVLWQRCVIKIHILDILHRSVIVENATFWKMVLSPSSDESTKTILFGKLDGANQETERIWCIIITRSRWNTYSGKIICMCE